MPPARARLFQRITEGIRISVRPAFLASQSSPAQARFVFSYQVRIENLGEAAATLLTRHWRIHDDVAGETVVDGDGVIGEQPKILPRQVHEYRSFCVLQCASGWMEGHYHFVRADGSAFDAMIPRFTLSVDSPEASGGSHTRPARGPEG